MAKKREVTVDLNLVAVFIALSLLVLFSAYLTETTIKRRRIIQVKKRAINMVALGKLDKWEMKQLKEESLPKWVVAKTRRLVYGKPLPFGI